MFGFCMAPDAVVKHLNVFKDNLSGLLADCETIVGRKRQLSNIDRLRIIDPRWLLLTFVRAQIDHFRIVTSSLQIAIFHEQNLIDRG